MEVAIFAREDFGTEGEEVWPADVELGWPPRLVPLAAAAEEQSNQLETDPFSDSAEALDSSDSESPESYEARPAGERQLNAAVQRLGRRPEFRLLFHERWIQPARSRDTADHVLVLGGERYDDHYELEGSLSVGVERYLHLGTDLWLSRFVANRPGEQHWQTLPAIPLAPAARNMEDGPLFSSLHDLMSQRYRAARTAVMRQSRRMRSGELHYLDHPLLALLVQVTEVETPETATTTASEPPASATAAPAPR